MSHVHPVHQSSYHDDLIPLVATTPAERHLDPALTAMIASELLGIRKGNHVRLDVGLLEFTNTDILFTVVTDDLDLVFVVAHGQIDRRSLLR
jgi:hypothetical protein